MTFPASAAIAIGMALTTGFALAEAVPSNADSHLGKPFTIDQPRSIHEILTHPADFIQKTVQVKGRITQVCQMMGCWMALADINDPKQSIRIQVEDGEIVFPKDSPGRIAIAEGILTKQELTRDEAVAKARHEAEEQGRKFNPDSIQHGAIVYEIRGTAASIADREQ